MTTAIYCILFFGIGCIIIHRNKIKSKTVRRSMLGWFFFCALLLWISTYYKYQYLKKEYHHIYTHSITNSHGTISDQDKWGVKVTLQNNKEYFFDPYMSYPELDKYITKKGYMINKKANSDTICLTKDDRTIICRIKEPKF